MNNLPKPGSRWQQVSTKEIYTVLDVCNQAATEVEQAIFPLIVAYYDEDHNVRACRLDVFRILTDEVNDEQA